MRILILVEGTLGERRAGPSIRALGLARGLAGHEITLAARGDLPRDFEGMAVVPFTRRAVAAAVRRHDAVIAPWIPPYAYVARRPGTRLIADLYDPLDLEMRAVGGQDTHEGRMLGRLEALQARNADLLLVATARQADRLRARHPDASDRILVVPFGIDDPPPGPGSRRGEHAVDRGAGPVILWWGSLWRWLDPVTAVEAVALVREQIPDARLVFSAGRPQGAAASALVATEAARAAAARHGLTDDGVVFLEDWIPYSRRHEILGWADVGLVLHGDAQEARFAIRARVLDYVWAGVPCVISGHDELALEIDARGAGAALRHADAAAVAEALARLLVPRRRAEARAAMKALAAERRWTVAVAPLSHAISRGPRPAGRRPLVDVGSYYAAQSAALRRRRP